MYKSIHDMDSFMWVLIYLCLTRKGPGGERRDELCFDATLDDTTKRVKHIVSCFFERLDREFLDRCKTHLFVTPGDMEEWITSEFHPYFEALKPLVSEWWQILQRSYRCCESTTIHDLFLAAIEKAIQGLPSTDPDPDPDAAGKKRELDRRCVDLLSPDDQNMVCHTSSVFFSCCILMRCPPLGLSAMTDHDYQHSYQRISRRRRLELLL